MFNPIKNQKGFISASMFAAVILGGGLLGIGLDNPGPKDVVAKEKFFENYPEAHTFVIKNEAYTKVCYIDGTYPGPYRATPRWQVNSEPCPQ